MAIFFISFTVTTIVLAKVILSEEEKALTDNVSLEEVNINVTMPLTVQI